MGKIGQKTTWKRSTAVFLTVCLIGLLLTSCGSRLSGTYVPEEPDNQDVLFDSLRFEGKTVYVEAAGSSIGMDYRIKDGMLTFKDDFSFQIHGESVPTSLIYTKLKNGTFWLGGIHYVPVN